jgi:hypothetical protein
MVNNAAATEASGFIPQIRRTFEAEHSRVFDAFTKPEVLA